MALEDAVALLDGRLSIENELVQLPHEIVIVALHVQFCFPNISHRDPLDASLTPHWIRIMPLPVVHSRNATRLCDDNDKTDFVSSKAWKDDLAE